MFCLFVCFLAVFNIIVICVALVKYITSRNCCPLCCCYNVNATTATNDATITSRADGLTTATSMEDCCPTSVTSTISTSVAVKLRFKPFSSIRKHWRDASKPNNSLRTPVAESGLSSWAYLFRYSFRLLRAICCLYTPDAIRCCYSRSRSPLHFLLACTKRVLNALTLDTQRLRVVYKH